jgi:integrase
MTTVTQALAFYAKEKSQVADQKRLLIAVKHLTAIMGRFKLQDVDLSTCKIYTRKRKEKNVCDATIARELGVLKAAARFAVKWKMINPDKIPIIEIPGNLPKRQVWLLKDELDKILNIAKREDFKLYAFIEILYCTASRRKAIEELEWSQVNFETHDRPGVIFLDKPDNIITKKRRPPVPIVPAVANALDILWKNKTSSFSVFGNKVDRLRQFQQILKRAGLERVPERDGRPAGKITPHVLRHSRATHLLEAGMPIYTVAQLLGDNPLTVQRTYAHACTSNLEQDLKKFS